MKVRSLLARIKWCPIGVVVSFFALFIEILIATLVKANSQREREIKGENKK